MNHYYWGAMALIVLALPVLLFSVFFVPEPAQAGLTTGLVTFTEQSCVDEFGEVSCIENTVVQCNGQEYRIPKLQSSEPNNVQPAAEVEVQCSDLYQESGAELVSPADHIQREDIHLFEDEARIFAEGIYTRKILESNSMDPVFDLGSTVLEVPVVAPGDVAVGDIIAYNKEGFEFTLVHRVVEISADEEGIYFITKGDNYWRNDANEVRFDQVEGLVVGVLY